MLPFETGTADEPLHAPGALGRVLARFPQFDFDIVEHICTVEVIEEARSRCEALVAAVASACSPESPWRARREDIRSATAALPAYAAIDWSSEDYETTIPLIDKVVLRNMSEAFMSQELDPLRLWSRPTSGTSGPPVTVYLDALAFAERQYFSAYAALRYTDLVDRARDGRQIFTLSVLDNSYLQNRVWIDPSGFTGATLQVVFDTMDLASTYRLVAMVQEHRPAILSLKPNILHICLEALGSDAGTLGTGVIAILSGGAELSPALRLKAEQRIGVPVINVYGMSEIGGIASSCSSGTDMHLHEEALICEVLLEDGHLVRSGVGELVVSSIRNRAMPILRYRTGDFAKIIDTPCSCGRSGRRLAGLLGRRAAPFRLASGGYFAPTNLNPLFEAFNLRELQVTQLSIDQIELKVEFLISTNVRQLTELRAAAERITAGSFAVNVVATTFKPGEKFQRYRSFVS